MNVCAYTRVLPIFETSQYNVTYMVHLTIPKLYNSHMKYQTASISFIHVIVDEGYVKVSDIVETLLEQHHNRDRDLREEDVIRVVKNCPPTCPQEWLILDETPPVRVKAKWGHIMPVRHMTLQLH